jgi:hypothetical protein
MASIDTIYVDINRIQKIAEDVYGSNYNADADMGEQSERLAEIAEIATRASKAAAAVNKALGG